MKRCKVCKGLSRVLDTRAEPDRIKRRRICETCGNSWFTVEIEMPEPQEDSDQEQRDARPIRS